MVSDEQGPKAGPPCILVVTGSATDLRAVAGLLGRLPPQPDAALVVVLQPREGLHEDAFRQAATPGGHEWAELADGAPVDPGRLYLFGPGPIPNVEDGRFRTRSTGQASDAAGEIDSFLRSLAREAGGRAIVVALAGTGGDATPGLREVKAAGGLVLAEDRGAERAGDLPATYGPAALADAVLPVDDLADRAALQIAQVIETQEAGDPDGRAPDLAIQGERPRAGSGDIMAHAEGIAERYAPAYVVVDRSHRVLRVSGPVGPFINPVGGTDSPNLLQLAHPDLRLDLRAALTVATEEERTVTLDDRAIQAGGRRIAVDLVIEPVRDYTKALPGFLVLFRERPITSDGSVAKDRPQATAEEPGIASEELRLTDENLAHRLQELELANGHLRNLLESTQIATLFLDRDLRVTNFTPAIVEVFPLLDSDLGRPIGQIGSRLSYEELEEDARRVLRELAPMEREVADPAARACYLVRVLPYRGTDDIVAGVVLTFVDVTARRKAEEALSTSEERFRAIVETARDYAVFTTDEEGRIETWPPGAQEVLGWSADEAVGQPVDMTFTPEDRQAGAPETERLVARTAGQSPDVRWHLRKNGSRVFIDGMMRPLRGPDGALSGFVKVGQDVTARHATQEALRASEERFRQFGDASADVLWIRDAESLAFEYISPAAEEVYGTPAERFLEGNHMLRWLGMVVPEDREVALDHIRRVRAGEHVLNLFRILRRSDGRVRWIRDTAFPLLDEEGRVQRIGGIGHDATEEIELQDRLKVLVAELQHRTRNLMGVVRSVADRTMASSTSLEDFQDRFRDRLGALARVNGLLSRLQDGHRIAFDELLLAELNGHGVLDRSGKGTQVRLRGPEGIRLRSATVQTFALALHELATNALKHGALSRPEGRLEVEWDLADGDGGEMRLRVDWRESGVNLRESGQSLRRGYGRELIERALPYQLQARTAYELTTSGVRCTIELPVSTTLAGLASDPEEPHA